MQARLIARLNTLGIVVVPDHTLTGLPGFCYFGKCATGVLDDERVDQFAIAIARTCALEGKTQICCLLTTSRLNGNGIMYHRVMCGM